MGWLSVLLSGIAAYLLFARWSHDSNDCRNYYGSGVSLVMGALCTIMPPMLQSTGQIIPAASTILQRKKPRLCQTGLLLLTWCLVYLE